MNTYDGLFIFGETVRDERVGEMTNYVVGEIEKLGGKILNKRDMGQRSFARPLQKKEAGVFVAVTFEMDPDKMAALNARYKLNDDVFRCQIVKLNEKQAAQPPPVSAPATRSDRPDRPDRSDRSDRSVSTQA